MKLTIMLGCYNEKATIIDAIEEAKALPIDKEIIVIDNASTDGTREILERLDDDSIKLVLKDRNRGPGHSVKLAISMAKGEYLYCPGTDREYRMTDVLTMFDKLEAGNLDAVFGSRLFDRKGSLWELVKERPFWLGSIISTVLVNMLYRARFTDVIAPKLINTATMRSIGLESDGHVIEFETVSWLCKAGCRIGEIPIYYRPRTREEGKTIKAFDLVPALWAIIKVRFLKKKHVIIKRSPARAGALT